MPESTERERSATRRQCPGCARRGALTELRDHNDLIRRAVCRWCEWDATIDDTRAALRRRRGQEIETLASTVLTAGTATFYGVVVAGPRHHIREFRERGEAAEWVERKTRTERLGLNHPRPGAFVA